MARRLLVGAGAGALGLLLYSAFVAGLLSLDARADFPGQLPASTVLGNSTVARHEATALPLPTCTVGSFLTWTPGTGFVCVPASSALPPCLDSTALAYTNCVQTWTKPQRGAQVTVTISGSTFTLDLATAQHFSLTLDHSACPCTIANPTNIATAPGQVGMLDITQSSTGGDTVTWDTDWRFPSATPPTLSTTANSDDFFAYYVKDATHIVVGYGALNAN